MPPVGAGLIERETLNDLPPRHQGHQVFFVQSRDRETKILLGVLGVFVVRIALKFQIR